MNITERAEHFARRFVREKPYIDTRSTDEKLAEFANHHGIEALKRARQRRQAFKQRMKDA